MPSRFEKLEWDEEVVPEDAKTGIFTNFRILQADSSSHRKGGQGAEATSMTVGVRNGDYEDKPCVCAHAGICMVESWRNANLIVKWETETRKDIKAEKHVLFLS